MSLQTKRIDCRASAVRNWKKPRRLSSVRPSATHNNRFMPSSIW